MSHSGGTINWLYLARDMKQFVSLNTCPLYSHNLRSDLSRISQSPMHPADPAKRTADSVSDRTNRRAPSLQFAYRLPATG